LASQATPRSTVTASANLAPLSGPSGRDPTACAARRGEREATEATLASQALCQPSHSLHRARPQPPSSNPATSSQIWSPDAATRRQPPRRPPPPDPATCAARRGGGGGSYRGHPGLPGAPPAPAPPPPRAHTATVAGSGLLAPPSTRSTSSPRGPPNRARGRCRWQIPTGSACPPSICCQSAVTLSPTRIPPPDAAVLHEEGEPRRHHLC
jgi:hypothetical protein